jgi:hypothetical protein
MDWLGSDHVGTPTYTHVTIAEACFLCVVRAEGLYAARKIAKVIQNHDNEHVRGIGQGEARHRKYKTLKTVGGQNLRPFR